MDTIPIIVFSALSILGFLVAGMLFADDGFEIKFFTVMAFIVGILLLVVTIRFAHDSTSSNMRYTTKQGEQLEVVLEKIEISGTDTTRTYKIEIIKK